MSWGRERERQGVGWIGDPFISSVIRPQLYFLHCPSESGNRAASFHLCRRKHGTWLCTHQGSLGEHFSNSFSSSFSIMIFKTLHDQGCRYISLNFCSLMMLCAQPESRLTPLSPGSASKVKTFALRFKHLQQYNNTRNFPDKGSRSF